MFKDNSGLRETLYSYCQSFRSYYIINEFQHQTSNKDGGNMRYIHNFGWKIVCETYGEDH